MSDVLVLAEHHESDIRKVTFELITAARELGAPVVLWLGSGCDDAVVAALGSYGAARVLVAGSSEVSDHPVAPGAEVVASLIESMQPARSPKAFSVAARLCIRR